MATKKSSDAVRGRWASAGMLKLLYPGVGVKRWLVIGAAGIAVCAIGFAYLLRKVFALTFPDFLPGFLEGWLILWVGVGVILLSIYGLYHTIGPLLFDSTSFNTLAETIYIRRSRGRGPRIVAIGGGTGLSVLLRGLKAYTDNLSAIVTVGDDGGSSGRLRRELGVPPPGDFRNCIVAMSDAEDLVTELFQYRFDQGGGLGGHSFGNLFIVAMANVTGSFEKALYESSRVLLVHGKILPATMANLNLSAHMADGTIVKGESAIAERGGPIERLVITPEDSQAYGPAVKAIEEAQLIVIGPGSLYTSILPNLLVKGIAEAIENSSATKAYVCNIATEPGETEGYTLADHIEVLQAHTFPAIVDHVVANYSSVNLEPSFRGGPVVDDGRPLPHVELVPAHLGDAEHPLRHDSVKLAQTVMSVYHGLRMSSSPVGVATRILARAMPRRSD